MILVTRIASIDVAYRV